MYVCIASSSATSINISHLYFIYMTCRITRQPECIKIMPLCCICIVVPVAVFLETMFKLCMVIVSYIKQIHIIIIL